MKIKRISTISGIERTKDIPVDINDWFLYEKGYLSLDDSMPYLNQTDRDFILSGIIPEEWQEAFKENIVE